MKKQDILDMLKLLGLGAIALLLFEILVIVVGIIIGILVAYFTDVPWYVAILGSVLALKFIILAYETYDESKPVRCPQCNHKIMTSKPVLCEKCGGPADLPPCLVPVVMRVEPAWCYG
jgi:NAD/NADP transhydrogenase beta subunit